MMKRGLLLFTIFMGTYLISTAQEIVYGTFPSTDTTVINSWMCNEQYMPEISKETLHGGDNTTNMVAEVNADNAICQDVDGLISDVKYKLSFMIGKSMIDASDCTDGEKEIVVTITNTSPAIEIPIMRIEKEFKLNQYTIEFTPQEETVNLSFMPSSSLTESCGVIIDEVAVSRATSAALPITLLDFNGYSTNDGIVILEWKTASEINNEIFSIERSQDGILWQSINQVAGAGNSNVTKSYGAADLDPIDIAYYRLKQTDFDGQYAYSKIITVTNNDNNTAVKIAPNPTNGLLNITAPQDNVVTSLYNVQGQLIQQHTTSGNHALDMSTLHNGLYVLNVYDTNNHLLTTRKVIKE